MGMNGNLRDVAIPDLIQLSCQDRKSARLSIEHLDEHAALYFKDGNLVHAVLGNNSGEEVLFNIIGWEEGTFNLETGIQSPAITVSSSWPSLLLEGARRLDEERNKDNKPQSTTEFFTEVDSMAPKFDEILKELSGEITGCVACALVGMDGINIASHTRAKNTDPELMSAQGTMLLKLVDTAVDKLKAGQIEDNLTTTANAYMMMRFLPGKDYYLAVVADRKTGNLGNMRLIGKTFAERLAKAMPR